MTLPAIRPHQKTLLHLRDSATVDFGPAGQTLTNNGVTVNDDVFTFDGASHIDQGYPAHTAGFHWTVSLWFKSSYSSNVQVMYADVDSSASQSKGLFLTLQTDGSMIFYTNSTSSNVWTQLDTVSGGYADGEWHHVTATRSGEGMSLWIDNVEVDTATTTAATTYQQESSAIGYDPRTGRENNWFVGDMADIKVLDYGLTAGEVFDLYNGGRSYDLPERKQLPNTRLHLVDGLTDAGFYGTEVTNNGATYANGVYSFDGTADYFDIGTPLTDAAADSFAIVGWFRHDATGSIHNIYQENKDDDSPRNGLTMFSNGGLIQAYYNASASGSNDSITTTGTYDDGEWHHVAFVKNGTSIELRIDYDAEVVSTTDIATFDWGVANVGAVGRDSRTTVLGRYWDGELADLRAIASALTAGEVANLYRKGIPALRDAEVLRIDPARYSGSGDLIDQTGGGNDLTLPSGYTVSDGVVNTVDTANGPNTGVSLDGIAGTVSMWVKSTDTDVIGLYQAATRFALCWEDGGSGSTATGVSNVTLYVDGAAITDNRNTFHDAVADGTWHHIAMTGDFNAGWSTVHLFRAVSGSLWRMNGSFDKLLIASGVKYTANQIAFLASSREFADPFPEPFLGLGGETLNIQPSRYSGNGDLLDESGNGNDLTLPSGYSVADGVISSDGTADGPDSGVSFTSQTASIGVWVKTTDTTFMIASSGAAEYLGAAVNNGPAHHSGTSNATTYIDGETGSYHTQSQLLAALNDGQWHHFAFTADFNSSWGNAQFFDYNSSSSWRFTGETDDLRIETGRKWSAEEVKLLASSRGVELPNTRDAKLYVSPSYDDASNGGTSVIDYSGNQNAGAFTGSPAWTADTNESGTRALSFGGSGDYIDFGQTVLTEDLPQLSLVAWINATDTANQKNVIGRYQSQGERRSLILDVQASGQLRFVSSSGGTSGTTSNSTTSDLTSVEGRWVPVVVTFDGPDVTFHVAGETEAESGRDFIENQAVDFYIGHVTDSALDFEGLIDDVLVFDRVLTPGEIAFFSDKRNPYGTPYTAPGPGPAGFIPIILF